RSNHSPIFRSSRAFWADSEEPRVIRRTCSSVESEYPSSSLNMPIWKAHSSELAAPRFLPRPGGGTLSLIGAGLRPAPIRERAVGAVPPSIFCALYSFSLNWRTEDRRPLLYLSHCSETGPFQKGRHKQVKE